MHTKLEAVIVDDEEKALQSLSWELTNFSDEIKVVASFTDPFEALKHLENYSPDCLFLDIEMPTMDGFQFIQKLKNKDFPVVITTAYNQYAIKALKNEGYKLQAILRRLPAALRRRRRRHLLAGLREIRVSNAPLIWAFRNL